MGVRRKGGYERMIKVIAYSDWYEVYDDDGLFYEGHSLGDALYEYCQFHGIKYEYEEREDED